VLPRGSFGQIQLNNNTTQFLWDLSKLCKGENNALVYARRATDKFHSWVTDYSR
jgi:hypothetical protein